MICTKDAIKVELNRLKTTGLLSEESLTDYKKNKEFANNASTYLTLKEIFFNLQKQDKLTINELNILKKIGQQLNILENKLSSVQDTLVLDINSDNTISKKKKKISAEQNITKTVAATIHELYFHPETKTYLKELYPDKNFIPDRYYDMFYKEMIYLLSYTNNYKLILNYNIKLYDILRKIYIVNGLDGLIAYNELNSEIQRSSYNTLINCMFSIDDLLNSNQLYDKYGSNYSNYKDSIILNLTSKDSFLKKLNTENTANVIINFFFLHNNEQALLENYELNTYKIKEEPKYRDLTAFINTINIKTDTQINPSHTQEYISNVASKKIAMPTNNNYVKKI